MTAGDNASASASSKNKEGGTMPQISRSTEDEHGSHTTKTTETHDSDGKNDTKIVSKGPGTKKDKESDVEQAVFAKAGGTFVAAGGAVASVAGGKGVASAERVGSEH
jgi:hypothetical protein